MNPRAVRFVVFAFVLVLAPVALWIVYDLRSPDLWEGDVLETRDCRWCAGSGIGESEGEGYAPTGGRCSSCGGTGRVRVVVPGPNRPTHVRGAVVRAEMVGPLDSYSTVKPQAGPSLAGPPSFRRHDGTIGGARLTFRHDDGETREVECTPYGLFHETMRPGEYEVTISAPGRQTLAGSITVPILSEPIWLEEGRVIYEPESGAEARSLYGLEVLVALARDSDEAGWVRLEAGAP